MDLNTKEDAGCSREDRSSVSSTSETMPLSHYDCDCIKQPDAAVKCEGISDIPSLCKLCLEDGVKLEDMIVLKSCGCAFCLQCMRTYVEVLIRDGVVISISCPDSNCETGGIISCDEIEFLSQPDTYKKYKRLKFEQEVATDPRRTFCPQVSCSTVCHVCNNSGSSVSTAPTEAVPVQCPTCHLMFCYICKAEWKPSHKCNDYTRSFGSELQKLQNRTGFSLSGPNEPIKRCPVCNILIEKDRGCAQMICKNCSHVFCWYCLKLLDNDFMLRHYDKGPCRNMLGHSRAQVFQHRIGIVGLFTAFSLLLLVASPVLILAAPVILCCKCKECCQQAINRAHQHRGSVELQMNDRTSRQAAHRGNRQDDIEQGVITVEMSNTNLSHNPHQNEASTSNRTVLDFGT
uniref:RBR-type E3 ubiquitin transferase n=1 Tax=Ciona intestinalis TaxID=7719 RepID=F6SPV5_CIOIN